MGQLLRNAVSSGRGERSRTLRKPFEVDELHAALRGLVEWGVVCLEAHSTITSAESDLGSASDVADGLWQPFNAGSQGLTDACWIAIGPCPFDENAASTAIAGERKASSPHGVTGRTL